jgi:predicted MFS family arabinose efflux permease
VLAAFFAHESRIAKEPLMPLSLWKIPALATANATMLFMSMGMFAMWYFVSLDLQIVRGYSPLKAGLAFLPQTLAIIIGAQISSRSLQKIGARRLAVTAGLISAIGSLWLSRSLDGGNVFTHVILPGTVITFGLGLAITPVISSAMAGVDRRIAGLASGLINTSRQVGGSIGLAVLITLANDRTHALTQADGFKVATTEGYQRGLFFGAVFLLLAAGTALLFTSPKAPAQPAEAQASTAVNLATE